MGAIRRHGDGVAEVKRMYTLPSHQGRGLGRAIVARIEAQVAGRGVFAVGAGDGFEFRCG